MKTKRGFTIPEMMIALVLGLFLLGVTLSLFVMSSGSVSATGQYNQIQESARLAMRTLQSDLAQVEFFADLTGQDLQVGTNLRALPALAGNDCEGAGPNNATFPTGVGHFRKLWAFRQGAGQSISCENGALTGSDVLQIKRLDGREVAAGEEDPSRYYFAANVNEGGFYPGNGAIPLIPQRRSWQYLHRVYYVRNNAGGVPSLYRHTLSTLDAMEGPESLVEGVEALQYEFGVDVDGDAVADTYLNSELVTPAIWDQSGDRSIVAVRIHMVVRSLDQDPAYNGEAMTFALPAGDRTFEPDNFRRRAFTTTVLLRNPEAISRRNG